MTTATTTKPSYYAICENSNLASFCQVCVNYRVCCLIAETDVCLVRSLIRLDDYNSDLRLLKSKRDALYSRLAQALVAKGKADDQHNWRDLQNEKLARLRGKLRLRKQQVSQGKAKIENKSHDQKVKYELLESAMNLVEKIRTQQIEKYYPNLICTQSLGLMAITSKRLHKQSVIIKQIFKLFPQRRVHIDGERKDGYGGPYATICNARLPRGLDPHSVPPKNLAPH
ncbi:hypothetical protein SASPL_103125 [Salvia splendens]|uniref:Uncharacterized protein n=1 Tax=Salvia splendens TaxID=180675 RepID=A0A8X8YSI3_SALSN|nr:hypothetical protein SASPL_103125 [Salvia splendens]